eukprot:382460_1
MAEQLVEAQPQPVKENEFVWEIKEDEWNAWKNAAEGDHFESKDFELYGVTWSIGCYPNGEGYEGDFVLGLKYKSATVEKIRINYKFTCQDKVKRFNDTFSADNNSSYDDLCELSELKDSDCNQLSIKLTIEDILIPSQDTNDQFDWIIDPTTLDASNFKDKSYFEDKSKFKSPDFEMSDGTKWQGYCIPFGSDETIKVGIKRYDCAADITAATYLVEFVELGVKSRRAYPFTEDDDIDEFEICKKHQTKDFKKWTFRYKIIPSYKTTVHRNGLNWKISNDLMQQFKTAGLNDSFLSPPFICNDGFK